MDFVQFLDFSQNDNEEEPQDTVNTIGMSITISFASHFIRDRLLQVLFICNLDSEEDDNTSDEEESLDSADKDDDEMSGEEEIDDEIDSNVKLNANDRKGSVDSNSSNPKVKTASILIC